MQIKGVDMRFSDDKVTIFISEKVPYTLIIMPFLAVVSYFVAPQTEHIIYSLFILFGILEIFCSICWFFTTKFIKSFDINKEERHFVVSTYFGKSMRCIKFSDIVKITLGASYLTIKLRDGHMLLFRSPGLIGLEEAIGNIREYVHVEIKLAYRTLKKR